MTVNPKSRHWPRARSALDLKALPHDRVAWIDGLVANPILIERPIIVTGDGRAVVGRPPEAVRARH